MKEEAKSPRLYDSRIVTRNIRKGLLTRKDYDKFLQSLPDATDKIAPPEAATPAPATAEGGAAPMMSAPTPIIAIPPAPGSPELQMESDEDLEDDELEDEALAEESGGEPPPTPA